MMDGCTKLFQFHLLRVIYSFSSLMYLILDIISKTRYIVNVWFFMVPQNILRTPSDGIATDSLNKTVYNVLVDDEIEFTDIIMKTKFGFDLAPSNIDLA